MKLFEYFYQGKPVLSTDIIELRSFPKYVKIGNNAKEWEHLIKLILKDNWSNKYQYRQRKLAIVNSWENKILSILSKISI